MATGRSHKFKDISGQRFGRLVAVEPVGKTPARKTVWLCRCDCGQSPRVVSGDLASGKVVSCGCHKAESAKSRFSTHGLRRSPLYGTWANMVNRCTNPNSDDYADYGGRGITICDEWQRNFQAFHDYVTRLSGYGNPGYTLDRADNSLGYQPGNMRWATATEQSRNRRYNHLVTHLGKTQCLSAWAEETGIKADTIRARLRLGWSIDRALSTPTRGR